MQLFRFFVSEKLRRISFKKCFNFAKHFETNPSLSVDGGVAVGDATVIGEDVAVDGFTVAVGVGGGVAVEGFSFVSVFLFAPSSVASFSEMLLHLLLLLLLLLLVLLLLLLLLLLFSLYLIPLLLTS